MADIKTLEHPTLKVITARTTSTYYGLLTTFLGSLRNIKQEVQGYPEDTGQGGFPRAADGVGDRARNRQGRRQIERHNEVVERNGGEAASFEKVRSTCVTFFFKGYKVQFVLY